eukprot:gene9954-20698_t
MEHLESLDNCTQAAIMWPNEQFSSFEDAIEHAYESHRQICILTGTVITLNNSLYCKGNGKVLHIIGERGKAKPSIHGFAHSIFVVGGRGSLVKLENLDLVHCCDLEDKRLVGGVVFCRHQSNTELRDCDLVSHRGFCVWGVQSANMKLYGCSLRSVMRSGCVSFGKAKLTMVGCDVWKCAQHGICLRGSAQLNLDGCTVRDCMVRGIYGYHRVTIEMTGCTVTGTQSESHAAVEVWGCDKVEAAAVRDDDNGSEVLVSRDCPDQSCFLQVQKQEQNQDQETSHPSNTSTPSPRRAFGWSDGSDTLHIRMKNCVLRDNAGFGLRYRGAVSLDIDSFSCDIQDVCNGNDNGDCDKDISGEGHGEEHGEEKFQAHQLPPCEDKNGVVVNTSSVVWEYEYDDDIDAGTVMSRWRSYDSNICSQLETARSLYKQHPSSSSTPFLDNDDYNMNNLSISDVDVNVDRNSSSTSTTTLSHISDPNAEGTKGISNETGTGSGTGLSMVYFSIDNRDYCVDIHLCLQTNLQSHFVRSVRRRIL